MKAIEKRLGQGIESLHDFLKNQDLHKRAEFVVVQGTRLGAEFTVQPTCLSDFLQTIS